MEYKPQDNFYLYQNNEWLNDPNNKIPDDESSWGSFGCLHEKSIQDQINIVNGIIKNKGKLTTEEHMIKILYEKNMDRLMWKSTYYDCMISKMIDIENKFNTKSYSGLGNIISYCIYNEITNFIELCTSIDLDDSSKNILTLSPDGLSLPTRDHYFDSKFTDIRNEFRNHLHNVKNIINNNYNLSDTFVNDIYEFETNLAKITMAHAQMRQYDKACDKVNMNNFSNKLNELKFFSQKIDNYSNNDIDYYNKNYVMPKNYIDKTKMIMDIIYNNLDLINIMKNNYKNNYGEYHENMYTMCVFDSDYFKRLFPLLYDNYDKILSYVQYKIIMKYHSTASKELDDEFFNFYSKKINGQKKQKSNVKKSITLINNYIGEMMGKLYVKYHFSEVGKKYIINMIHKVLLIMEKSIKNSDWLTNETKNKALLKLSKFTANIGYPDKWKDYNGLEYNNNDTMCTIKEKTIRFNYQNDFINKLNSRVDPSEWHMYPQTVNASFNPSLNQITFPAAILQPPFFQLSLENIPEFNKPEYKKFNFDILSPINYGAIVAVIAHEITHGYDDNGKKRDYAGNIINWWTDKDNILFKKKADMMAEQARSYEYIDSNNVSHTINSELTMGENLADIGGLSLSLQAMKTENDLLDGNNFKDGVLELFFRSYANIWKKITREKNTIQLLSTDPHAPADFRANLVKNMDEFYIAFNIKKGDKMYLEPNKRVKMW